ncbi:hypothetical protein OH76DRAFT_276045 [Lentinus brumalis]|uniref:Uncharacterized protein n=1 Tax=Lentinus brumalis TaxID=2498619 RepID=A0A371CL30_9APHY|nr:hypothetical protein OH76DRAFT_276045 [Polyporus brumalis]
MQAQAQAPRSSHPMPLFPCALLAHRPSCPRPSTNNPGRFAVHGPCTVLQLHTYVEADSLVSAEREGFIYASGRGGFLVGGSPVIRLLAGSFRSAWLPSDVRCPASEEESESPLVRMGQRGASSSAARLRATSVPRCPPPFARQAASPRDPGLRTRLRTHDARRLTSLEKDTEHGTGRMRNALQVPGEGRPTVTRRGTFGRRNRIELHSFHSLTKRLPAARPRPSGALVLAAHRTWSGTRLNRCALLVTTVGGLCAWPWHTARVG